MLYTEDVQFLISYLERRLSTHGIKIDMEDLQRTLNRYIERQRDYDELQE